MPCLLGPHRCVSCQRQIQDKDSDQAADTVIGQSPKAGAGAEKDDEIKLDVSKGPAQVNVPDLTNQPCQQAAQTLQGMNPTPRINFNPNGLVRQQNPAPNTPVAPQTEVVLNCL